MRVKIYIVTYRNDAVLKRNLDALFASDLLGKDPQITVVNNFATLGHIGLSPGIRVWDNITRPDFSNGHLARNWNECLMDAFVSLKEPQCDLCILMQNDTFVLKDWLPTLLKHHERFDFIQVGAGDQFMSFTPEAVRRVGLFDERFCSIAYQEADYFMMARLMLPERASINDFQHYREHNPLMAEESWGSVIITRDKSLNQSFHSIAWHEYNREVFRKKWGRDSSWKVEPVPASLQPRISRYFTYPYFEKHIETLAEQRYDFIPQVAPEALISSGESRELKFPPEFEPTFYRDNHVDLNGLDDAGLLTHYESAGRQEGRVSSPICLRDNLAAALAGVPALEIRPFHDPLLRGARVRYFDVLNVDELRKLADSMNLSVDEVDQIPSRIDYVSDSGDLSIVDKNFPLVVSSHCIEQQTDLVAHLNGVERILTPGGFYVLLVSDHRYTFDHFLPASTVADAIEAHAKKRTLHSHGTLIRQFTKHTHSDPLRHWKGDHGEPSARTDRIQQALLQQARREYSEVHAWQFTPQTFRDIVQALHARQLTFMVPHRVYSTPWGRCEFTAVLRRANS